VKPELDFLDVDDVLVLHERQLPRYGGASGVRDAAALDAAVAMARATFDGELLHADLYAMAAAYAFHLCRGHPFLDGNKRTALLAALVFLDLNGVIVADPEGRLSDAMRGVAEGRMDKRGLAALLRDLTVHPQTMPDREWRAFTSGGTYSRSRLSILEVTPTAPWPSRKPEQPTRTCLDPGTCRQCPSGRRMRQAEARTASGPGRRAADDDGLPAFRQIRTSPRSAAWRLCARFPALFGPPSPDLSLLAAWRLGARFRSPASTRRPGRPTAKTPGSRRCRSRTASGP
jgi:death-on-curing protein